MDSDDLREQNSWLRHRARRLMGSRLRGWTESGDLAQQVQVEALRTQDQKSFANLGAFRGWLLRILRNLAATESRRRGIEQVVGGGPEAPGAERTPSRIVESHDSGTWMRDRLGVLTDSERDVVLGRIVDGHSFRVIGEKLEIAEGNARTIFHRSMLKLRTSNGPDGCY